MVTLNTCISFILSSSTEKILFDILFTSRIRLIMLRRECRLRNHQRCQTVRRHPCYNKPLELDSNRFKLYITTTILRPQLALLFAISDLLIHFSHFQSTIGYIMRNNYNASWHFLLTHPDILARNGTIPTLGESRHYTNRCCPCFCVELSTYMLHRSLWECY